MDPENVRTIVTGAVTVTVGVVPSVLLYRQNRSSGAREAAERAAERAAESERREQDLRREQMHLDAESHREAYEQRRERFARYLRIMQKVSSAIYASTLQNLIRSATDDEQEELASAFEDLILDADPILASDLESARARLHEMVAASARGTKIDPPRDALDRDLEQIRRAAIRALAEADSASPPPGSADALAMSRGQEPSSS